MTRSIYELSIEGEQAPPVAANALAGKVSTSSDLRRVFDQSFGLVVYRRDEVLAAGGDVTINFWTALDRFGVALNLQSIYLFRVWIAVGQNPDSSVTIYAPLNELPLLGDQNSVVTGLVVGQAVQWDADVARPFPASVNLSRMRLIEEQGEGPVTVSIEMWGKR